MPRRKIRFSLLFIFAVLFACSFAYAIQLPKWFIFTTKDALKEWEEKVFKGRVFYSVKVEDKHGFLSAYSNNAASGILYRINFDSRKNPLVSWKWKVAKFPDKNKANKDTGWIEKDDYAARFYVIFPGFIFPFTKCIEYVWDRDIPAGTVLTNPYFHNLKIIVIESGVSSQGRWVKEERNIREDFRKIFKADSGKVGAIAVMTDTDNTSSIAEAYYDEIKVGYQNGKK